MPKAQNESPTLKLFYYHTPATKTCCVSCITLLHILCIIHHYMTLYNHITIAQKLFLTCSYRLNDITIFRATNAAKPSGITTYRAAITVK